MTLNLVTYTKLRGKKTWERERGGGSLKKEHFSVGCQVNKSNLLDNKFMFFFGVHIKKGKKKKNLIKV